MKIQNNPNKQITTSTKSSVPWSYLRDWSFISSRRGRTWGGLERCGVPKLYPLPPQNNCPWKLHPPLPRTIFKIHPSHPPPPPSSPFKSLLPSLQGVDFISYIKIPIVSSVGWDLKVHAGKKLVRGSGACSTRKFLNLGSRKCHLLRFLYDIFSK